MATFEQSLEQSIHNAVKEQIAKISSEEIAKAQENIERCIKQNIAQITLAVMKTYDVMHDRDRLIISVKQQ